MLIREGDNYRISNQRIFDTLEELLAEVEQQCKLGFGQVEEDPKRVKDLQEYLASVAKVRGSHEHDTTGTRYRKNPSNYTSASEISQIREIMSKAVSAHSIASHEINAQNGMGPYSQKVESLIQKLIHEIRLFARLVEVGENCPIYNTGLSVLDNSDIEEMQRGVIGPISVFDGQEAYHQLWNKIINAKRGDGTILRDREIVLGDPIFAISYKHNGPGGLADRMTIGDWVEINETAANRAHSEYFWEYFLWVDVEYARNRNKSESWATGGILAYLSCEVLTTKAEVQDSYWCRLERGVGTMSFGVPSEDGSGALDRRRVSPICDIHTVLKYAAQIILMTNLIKKTRLWEEDAHSLIQWALFATYKTPRVSIGLPIDVSTMRFGQPLVYGFMEIMSWWSPENCMPELAELFRSQKETMDYQKGLSLSWNGLNEWSSQHLTVEDDRNSPTARCVYDRIRAVSKSIEGGKHVVSICYTHFDGSESTMTVIVEGENVYNATVVAKKLGVTAVHDGLNEVELHRVKWSPNDDRFEFLKMWRRAKQTCGKLMQQDELVADITLCVIVGVGLLSIGAAVSRQIRSHNAS